MSKKESKNVAKNLVAGGIAGAMEAALMYPTEFVKTQLQLQAQAAKNAAKTGVVIEPKFRGVFHCATVTVKERGFFGLYRGLSSLVVGSIPKAAVRFAAYQQFANLLTDKETGKLTGTRTMLAGLGAGISEAILAVTPMETIKTKLIDDQNKANPRYRGLAHGVRTIVAEEGLRGIYKGLAPTCLKQGCNQATRFFIFNNLKNMVQGPQKRDLAGWESMGIGGVAGIISVYATMPFDVIKTRMQGLDAKAYGNSVQCTRMILQNEGVLAFWKGTTPRLARVMFSSGLIFTFQAEAVKVLTSLGWTD